MPAARAHKGNYRACSGRYEQRPGSCGVIAEGGSDVTEATEETPRPGAKRGNRQPGWSTAPRSPQRTNVLYREPNSRHSKTSARAPDGLGQGVSGQPVLPATPPDHQIDRQRCDCASFQAGSPRSQPPLTVRISPHARSHVAWRITNSL